MKSSIVGLGCRALAWSIALTVAAGPFQGCSDDSASSKLPDATSPSGIPLDTLLRAQVRLQACLDVDSVPGGADLAFLVARGAPEGEGWWLLSFAADCLADAQSCAVAAACVGVDLSAECSEHEFSGISVEQCVSDSEYQYCWNGNLATSDCGSFLYGAYPVCVVENPDTEYAETNCEAKPPECEASAGSNHCDGSRLHDCESSEPRILDCARLGLECIEHGDSNTCGDPAAAACADTHCDGTVLVTCWAGRELYRVDCAAVSATATCQDPDEVMPDQSFKGCVGPDGACGDGETRCQSSEVLEQCVLGTWLGVSCAELAGASCASTETGGACTMTPESHDPGRRQPR